MRVFGVWKTFGFRLFVNHCGRLLRQHHADLYLLKKSLLRFNPKLWVPHESYDIIWMVTLNRPFPFMSETSFQVSELTSHDEMWVGVSFTIWSRFDWFLVATSSGYWCFIITKLEHMLSLLPSERLGISDLQFAQSLRWGYAIFQVFQLSLFAKITVCHKEMLMFSKLYFIQKKLWIIILCTKF